MFAVVTYIHIYIGVKKGDKVPSTKLSSMLNRYNVEELHLRIANLTEFYEFGKVLAHCKMGFDFLNL